MSIHATADKEKLIAWVTHIGKLNKEALEEAINSLPEEAITDFVQNTDISSFVAPVNATNPPDYESIKRFLKDHSKLSLNQTPLGSYTGDTDKLVLDLKEQLRLALATDGNATSNKFFIATTLLLLRKQFAKEEDFLTVTTLEFNIKRS